MCNKFTGTIVHIFNGAIQNIYSCMYTHISLGKNVTDGNFCYVYRKKSYR